MSSDGHTVSRTSHRMSRTLAIAALTAGWLLVAYLTVTSSVHRLLPSATAPWPIGNVVAAMVLIYLPVVAAAAAVRTARAGNPWRTGVVHAGAMLGVLALLLIVLGG